MASGINFLKYQHIGFEYYKRHQEKAFDLVYIEANKF